eukprot:GCRY01002466.1.p1 GENE.GCRY01002466.1~~GCRY01002466.1.p1  ORF type:complete len:278 (-),score=28.55 GCRY01002466.1:470-1303(-)
MADKIRSNIVLNEDTNRFARRLQQLKEKWFKDKVGVRPTFVLCWGPPGSGKSYTVRKHLTSLGYDPDNFVPIIMDDIIQADDYYRQKVAEIQDYAQAHDEPEDQTTEKLEELFDHALESANTIAELMLEVAARQKFNIIFESTGSDRAVNWAIYMIKHCAEMGYATWMYYPWCSPAIVKQRMSKRRRTLRRMVLANRIDSMCQEAEKNFQHIAPYADSVWIVDNDHEDKQDVRVILHYTDQYSVETGRVRQQSSAQTVLPGNMGDIMSKTIERLKER